MSNDVKFIRVNGRIIPIRGNKPKTVRIQAPKQDNSVKKVAAAFTAAGGSLYLAGKKAEAIGRKAYSAGVWGSMKLFHTVKRRNTLRNVARAGRVAKKFGPRLSAFGSGLIVAGALVGAFSTFREK